MGKSRKSSSFFDAGESYTEAERLIQECREKGGNKLDFSHLSLRAIPPEIAELETLTELDITGSYITEIPGFIGDISTLKRLAVGVTYSSPHDRDNIILPDTLGNLKNLQSLYLGYCIPKIPKWLWGLANLSGLTIFNDAIETIPAAIGTLNELHSLRIHGEKISEIPGETGDCRLLDALELQCPQLKSLPLTFSNLKKLRRFYFSRCNFTAIPDYICGWTELEELALSMDNTFQGPYTDFIKIPKNIGNLKKLKLLKLDGTGIRKIPASLGECPLEQLTITGDFKNLPETFGKLSKLKELELNSYNLRTLPESFGDLSSLEKLELRGSVMELPVSFGNLSSLNNLSITARGITLPKTFGNLSSLKDLSFLTSGLNLPETFGKLSSLENIYIDDNKMTALPKSMGKCSGLKQLYLSGDNLAELPSSIGNLINLEEFSVNAFNLRKIPDAFGNLTELKSLDIFSGALTSIPKSIGDLKKLKTLTLDVYNANKPPESLKNLSYVKCPNINIGKIKQESTRHSWRHTKQRSNTVVDFDELKYMGYQYRWKIFEKCSLKELEALLCSAPDNFRATETDKEIVDDILRERRRLNRKFSWTGENIKRIEAVSDKFLAAWEEGFGKAKTMIDMLYERETDKDDFWDNYDVEIILHPYIFIKDDKTGEWETPDNSVYSVLTDYLPEWELTMQIGDRDYNPATKDEKGFREDTQVNHDLSWNIEGFGDIELQDHYICYAIHVLYSHNEWANEDILKINNIEAEVKVTHRHDSGVF
jgi:Leucine-rich repeat (LRR) protein